VKANEFYERARNVLALPLAEGLYLLGLFHLKTREDAKRADAALNAALAIQHEALDENDLPLAETMLALADARAKQSDLDSAIELANEALRIQLIQYYWEGPGIPQPVADTQARLDELRALGAHDQQMWPCLKIIQRHDPSYSFVGGTPCAHKTHAS
jgi:tetratricopeptide (TPR) repeat protein